MLKVLEPSPPTNIGETGDNGDYLLSKLLQVVFTSNGTIAFIYNLKIESCYKNICFGGRSVLVKPVLRDFPTIA